MIRGLGLVCAGLVLGSCVTVQQYPPPCDGCRFEVPPTQKIGEFQFTSDEPGFLFIRFVNDHASDSSFAIVVLVTAEKTKILHVVGPLKESADYGTFYSQLNRSPLYCPGGYFCTRVGGDAKLGECKVPSPRGDWKLKPRESPGPPPPGAGSIVTQAAATGQLSNDANAAANAANQAVQAASH
jgi:hypothetical protein